MKLITIDKETELPIFNPEIRVIREFKKIIERDRGSKGDSQGRKKQRALQELAFVHFMCVYDSRYNMYNVEEEKIEKIATDLALPEGWKPDGDIRLAIERYKDLLETPSKKLYREAVNSIDKLHSFLKEVDIKKTNNSGTLVFGPKDLQVILKGMPDVMKALDEVEKIVNKEEENKFRKEGNRGQFESSNQDVKKGDIF